MDNHDRFDAPSRLVASRFTLNDHVGTVLRLLLLSFLNRKSLVSHRIQWFGTLVLLACEVHSQLMRWVRPPGRMLKLSAGRCHVLDEEPTSGAPLGAPPVLLVHGFMGSHHYYTYLASALRAAGRRVVRLDNYGRGFSTAGAGPMDANLFVVQLLETLEHLGLAQVDLVGYSMGGAIAIAFAAKHPEKLRSLVLLAPAGMPSLDKIPKFASSIGCLPGIDMLLGVVIIGLVFSRKHVYGGDWELLNAGGTARLTELHAVEMLRLPVEGLRLPHAFGRTIARFPMGGLTAEARAFGELGGSGRSSEPAVQTLAVWGTRDSIIPAKGLEELRELMPYLQSHVFPTAGHAFPLERAEETAEVLTRFWSGQS